MTETDLDTWTAEDRKEISVFAAYCWGSCHGDGDPGCDLVAAEVLAGGPALAWYGPQWVDHMAPRGNQTYDDSSIPF